MRKPYFYGKTQTLGAIEVLGLLFLGGQFFIDLLNFILKITDKNDKK